MATLQPLACRSAVGPTIVIIGSILVPGIFWTWRYGNIKRIKRRFINWLVPQLQGLPYVGSTVQSHIKHKLRSNLTQIKAGFDHERRHWVPIETLPETGLSSNDITKRFDHLHDDYHDGKTSGAVYATYDHELQGLLETVWGSTALTNPLHSEWPLIHLMKAEIIAMCQQLLHGSRGAHGVITHGGSTSIFEACKTYVLAARDRGIGCPEIIAPDTVHVAFDKAARILNARLIKVPVNPHTGAADVEAMRAAITDRTCLMVGSAPSYSFGIMDPIGELAPMAQTYDVPFHVDSCLGGFLTAFSEEAGFNLPVCDFRVPGVTSISFDTHKYGQTPKGNSLLLFSRDYRKTPTHTYLEWCGGMYLTDTLDGSRSGADIATMWTTLCYLGRQAFVDYTRKILTLQRALCQELRHIDGISIPYDPQVSVVGIRVKPPLNALLVAQKFKTFGWSVNILQTPDSTTDGFHFCLTAVHTYYFDFVSSFIRDLRESLDYARDHPDEKPTGLFQAYGALSEGIPTCVQDQLGDGYARLQNALPTVTLEEVCPDMGL
jgi:sphinganine-1-phosphate aldolase